METFRAIMKPDKTVGISKHKAAQSAPRKFERIGASRAKMRTVADSDGCDAGLTGSFATLFTASNMARAPCA